MITKRHLTFIVIFMSVFFTTFVKAATDQTLASGNLSGSFSSWGKPSLKGSWKIVTTGDKTFIELGEDFKAKKGPDVKIFLSTTAVSKLNGDNVVSTSTFVHLLTEFEGKNRVEIPADTNIEDYQSLVFHCEAYSKLWGSASL